MTLTARLDKLRALRAQRQATIARKAARRQSVSYDYARLVRDTTAQIRAEMKLERSA